MVRRSEIRKKGACYESCYVFAFMYGENLCNYCCIDTGKPCRNYINAYWKIHRYRHYHKTKPKYPTTLDVWKKRFEFKI